MKKCILFFLILLPLNALAGETVVYCGGVAGIETLLDPASSLNYRKLGGGIFLHGIGWGRLTDQQKKNVVLVNRGAPYAVELGFGNGEKHDRAWAERFKESPPLAADAASTVRRIELLRVRALGDVRCSAPRPPAAGAECPVLARAAHTPFLHSSRRAPGLGSTLRSSASSG